MNPPLNLWGQLSCPVLGFQELQIPHNWNILGNSVLFLKAR